MDTEKTFFLDGELDNQPFCELSQDELDIVEHFVEINRHLQEIHSLFLVLNFNIDQLKKRYTLKGNGNLFCGQQKAESEEDYIAVNAFIINLIASGSTLKGRSETYIKSNDAIEAQTKEDFNNISHNLYGKSFSYRLLIHLRDFTQHGHLSVGKLGNNYFFDLQQIVEKPHFNHKKKLEDEMKQITQEIMDIYRDTPTLSLTMTIAEYVSVLFSLYYEFWKTVKNEFQIACSKFEKVKNAYPANVACGDNPFPGFFIYKIIDGNAHVIPPIDSTVSTLEPFQNEAARLLREYNDSYHQLADNALWVRCVNQQYIEIEQGLETL